MQNLAEIQSVNAIIAIKHIFSMHQRSSGPSGSFENLGLRLGFQNLPRNLVNDNA